MILKSLPLMGQAHDTVNFNVNEAGSCTEQLTIDEAGSQY